MALTFSRAPGRPRRPGSWCCHCRLPSRWESSTSLAIRFPFSCCLMTAGASAPISGVRRSTWEKGRCGSSVPRCLGLSPSFLFRGGLSAAFWGSVPTHPPLERHGVLFSILLGCTSHMEQTWSLGPPNLWQTRVPTGPPLCRDIKCFHRGRARLLAPLHRSRRSRSRLPFPWIIFLVPEVHMSRILWDVSFRVWPLSLSLGSPSVGCHVYVLYRVFFFRGVTLHRLDAPRPVHLFSCCRMLCGLRGTVMVRAAGNAPTKVIFADVCSRHLSKWKCGLIRQRSTN